MSTASDLPIITDEVKKATKRVLDDVNKKIKFSGTPSPIDRYNLKRIARSYAHVDESTNDEITLKIGAIAVSAVVEGSKITFDGNGECTYPHSSSHIHPDDV